MKRCLLLALAGMYLGLVGSNAEAAVRPHAFTLDMGAGGYFFESQQNIEDAPFFTLGLGYNLGTHWAIEGTAGYLATKLKDDENFDINAYIGRLDLIRHFGPDNVFVPYVAIGLGGLVFDPERNRAPVDKDGFLDWGLGFKVALSDNVALRADARHYITAENENFDGTEYQNFSATAGLQFQFGGGVATAGVVDQDRDGVLDSVDRCQGTANGTAVDAFGCPEDSDRDGVYDSDDTCPGTVAGTTVDATGCAADSDGDGVLDDQDLCADTPKGSAVDASGCPLPAPAILDSDRDGVADSADKCPGTPAEVPVNSVGCPRDSDGDMVFDVDDKCPGTPAGVAVDSEGCPVPLPEKASLDLAIEFGTDKAALSAVNNPELEKAAAFINSHPGVRIIIEGHTDDVGPASYNQKLSLRRAGSVRMALVERYGVPADRIVARGFGETRPVADNATPEGRLANRRVVVKIEE